MSCSNKVPVTVDKKCQNGNTRIIHILPFLWIVRKKKCRKTQISEGTVPQDFQYFFLTSTGPYLNRQKQLHKRQLCMSDFWFSNFAIEYLCKNKKIGKIVFATSFGAQVKSLKQKKISWHCSFKNNKSG